MAVQHRESKTDGPPDEELVAKSQKGDKEAYRLLVERYQPRVQAIAFEVVKSREDAEDIAQESFVKAYLSLPGFKGESSFYTWLYRITYNMAVDYRRKLSRRGGTHLEFKESVSVNVSGGPNSDKGSLDGPTPVFPSSVEGPQDALVRKETAKKLSSAFAELSEEHRAVMMLREVDGLNYEEISRVVGIPKGTVMSRLHYARKTLQKALGEYAPANFEELPDDVAEEEDNTIVVRS